MYFVNIGQHVIAPVTCQCVEHFQQCNACISVHRCHGSCTAPLAVRYKTMIKRISRWIHARVSSDTHNKEIAPELNIYRSVYKTLKKITRATNVELKVIGAFRPTSTRLWTILYILIRSAIRIPVILISKTQSIIVREMWYRWNTFCETMLKTFTFLILLQTLCGD